MNSKRHGHRLVEPLVRQNGELTPVTWEKALEVAAKELDQTRTRYGGDGFAMMSCSKANNETNYLAQKFSRAVMGSNNIDSCNRT